MKSSVHHSKKCQSDKPYVAGDILLLQMWLLDLLHLNKVNVCIMKNRFISLSHDCFYVFLFFFFFFSILMENLNQETSEPEAPASVSSKNESEKLRSKVCWWRRILGWKKVC